ncbi:MAG: glycosyltransferase [Suipraeoptans sp.]
MKKILVGFIMDGHSGGIDNYLINFLKNVNTPEVKIDFMTGDIDEELQTFLKDYNSELFEIPRLRTPFAQYRRVCELIKDGKYDMVYLNVSTAIDFIAAKAARKIGVKERIIHSHSSGNDCRNSFKRNIMNLINAICRNSIYKNGTKFIACSNKAAEWIFPKQLIEQGNFDTIFNAVNFEKFKFDLESRIEIREELCIENHKALVCIGNFCYQKNQEFLVKVIRGLSKSIENNAEEKYKLIFVGVGPEKEWIESLAEEAGILDCVHFIGYRRDVNKLLSGMDIFLLPSRFEGLPTVAVEAQCAGLPCIISDTITLETKITKNCEFLGIDDPDQWVETIIRTKIADEGERRKIEWIGDKKEYDPETIKKKQLELIESI